MAITYTSVCGVEAAGYGLTPSQSLDDCMPTKKRSIDERDIDDLLKSLTDRQIAELFGMTEADVATLRRERRTAQSRSSLGQGQADGSGRTDETS